MLVVKYTEAPMGQKSISKLLVSMYLEGATCVGKALAELKELLDEICNLLNGCWFDSPVTYQPTRACDA